MGNQTTLKDIAKILGVSVSTASKAMNNSSELNKDTIKRVQKLAHSLNYIPNDVARSLKTSKTKRIGLVVPNVKSEYFAKAVHAIEKEVSSLDYKLIICLSNDLIKKEAESIALFLNGSVDGVLVSIGKETQQKGSYDHFQKLLDRNVPLVMFDRVSQDIQCDKLTINDFEASAKAIRFLAMTNCKTLAFLSTISETSVSTQRQVGYRKTLEELNLNKPIFIQVPHYDQFEEILIDYMGKYPIDGILAVDQFSAICTLGILHRIGKRIPDEVSVIGFTDGLTSKFTFPALTMINQKTEEMGALAVHKLLERIVDKAAVKPEHIILDTDLVLRESTLPIVDC